MKKLLPLMSLILMMSAVTSISAQKRYQKLKYVQIESAYIQTLQDVLPEGMNVSDDGILTTTGGIDMFADLKAEKLLIGDREWLKDIMGNKNPLAGGVENKGGPPSDDKNPKNENPKDTNHKEFPGGAGSMTCSGCSDCRVLSGSDSNNNSYSCGGCYDNKGKSCGAEVFINKTVLSYGVTSQNQKITF